MTHSEPTAVGSRKFTLRDFMKFEAAGGILLLIAAIIAMFVANSPLASLYSALLDTPVAVQVGALEIGKPLLLWINDGLMAIFFFLIGLEIKREVLEGELSSFSQIILPGMGALGGMIIPASIYAAMNYGDPASLNGWAIPVATDIAFALGLLSVFGKRVPVPLKVFLLTLAIFDDLAAIIIIAIFYSGDLSGTALMIGMAAFLTAVLMNMLGVTRSSAYVLLGIVLWVAVLKSGVHATLAGVLIAFCIPIKDKQDGSPLRELEHNLHGPVAFAILPLFAFANAGIALGGIGMSDLAHPITMGVTLGLLVGKPVGVLLFVGLAIMLGWAKMPTGVNRMQMTGVSFACGIGFTMSLFISGLAFVQRGGEFFAGDRLGILIGSLVAGGVAWLLLQISLPRSASDTETVVNTEATPEASV